MNEPRAVIKRKYTRYKPDVESVAQIDPRPNAADFIPDMPALVFSESYGGCGLIFLKHPKIQPGIHIRVQVGKLTPMVAEVRWMRELDSDVIKAGFKFLE